MHHGIVKAYSFGEDARVIVNLKNGTTQESEDVKYVVHEYIRGWDLDQWLVNVGPIGEIIGKQFVAQLLDIMYHLHTNNISHNYMFNNSILLCPDTFQVKLTNFEYV